MQKPEYHHYIPRFILNRFNPLNPSPGSTDQQKNRKQRKQEAWKAAKKAKKKGLPHPESVRVFNMASRCVEQVEIRRVFGLYGFYEDANCTENMRHLEEKLGKLENQAALIIERLHVAATQPGNRRFTLPRRELQILRKFVFVMHYRSNAVDGTYFKEDHPRNVSVRNWIRKLKEEKRYGSDREIWLGGLQYYLDTGHNEMLSHAKSLESKSPELFIPLAELDVNTPPEHWFASAYETSFNNYYLGVWLAGQESEFVLGHNSYGLWEGTISGNIPQLFRIYVMSPMVTLVLKRNMSKIPLFKALEDSTLSGLPLRPASARYKRAPPHLGDTSSSEFQQYEALQHHLQSPNSMEDQFSFDINRLSKDQTYLVNQVVLENLHPDGSLVFRSNEAMLDTAGRYDTPEGPFRKKNRRAIAALGACLRGPNLKSPTPLAPQNEDCIGSPAESPTIRRALLLNRAVVGRLGWGESEFDSAFDDMLIDVLEGSIEFQSEYDRALYIRSLLPQPGFTTHPFIIRVHRTLARMFKYIEIMQAELGLPDLPPPSAKYVLVESLGGDDAKYLLNLLSSHIEALEGDWHLNKEEEAEDEASKVLEQVTAITYLDLLVDVDYRLATKFCGSVTFMRLANPSQNMPANYRPTAMEPETYACGVVPNIVPECSVSREPAGSYEGVDRGGGDIIAAPSSEELPGLPTEGSPGHGRGHPPQFPQGFVEMGGPPSEEGIEVGSRGEEAASHDPTNDDRLGGGTTRRETGPGGPVEGMPTVPRKRLVLYIPGLLLTAIVHLGAGVVALAVALAVEIWRALTGQPPDEPANNRQPDGMVFPAYVGHFFTAGLSLYAVLYLTAALLFGLPVYGS